MNNNADSSQGEDWTPSEKLRELVKSRGFELLKYYQTAEWQALSTFSQYSKAFSAVIISMFAAGFLTLTRDDSFFAAVALIPAGICLVRYFAISTLDRYYQRFLEAVVPQVKLKFALGIKAEIEDKFRGEHSLEENRGAHMRSREWISEFMWKGHNNVAYETYDVWCVLSVVYPIVAALRWRLLPDGGSTSMIVFGLTVSLTLALVIYMWGTMQIEKTRKGSL